jgi:biotin operon repressor
MGCATQEEIAKEIGYSQQAIGEFVNLLQNTGTGTNAVSGKSLANLPLIPDSVPQELQKEKGT